MGAAGCRDGPPIVRGEREREECTRPAVVKGKGIERKIKEECKVVKYLQFEECPGGKKVFGF